MKRILSYILILLAILSVIGCGDGIRLGGPPQGQGIPVNNGTGYNTNLITPTISSPTITGTAKITTANVTTLNAPTGRWATTTIATSDAPAISKLQADVVLTGTGDIAAIQSAFNTLAATGIHSKVQFAGISVNGTTQLNAVSNVDVDWGGVILTCTSNTGSVRTVVGDNITAAKWENGTFRRDGTPSAACVTFRIQGASTDRTFVFTKNKVYNDTSIGITGRSSCTLAIVSGASPTVTCNYILSSTSAHTQALYVGADETSLNTTDGTSTAYIAHNIIVGAGSTVSGDSNNSGANFDEYTNVYAEDNDFYASPNGIGAGVAWNWYARGYFLNNRYHGQGTYLSYGAHAYQGSAPTIVGGSMSSSSTYAGSSGYTADEGSAVSMTGTDITGSPYVINTPHMTLGTSGSVGGTYTAINAHPQVFTYYRNYMSGDNSTGFRPIDGHPYILRTIYIQSTVTHAGQTAKVGTTPGGSEIVSAASLANADPVYFTLPLTEVAANGMLYITPSIALADGDLTLYLTYSTNYAGCPGIKFHASGTFKATNSVFLGNGASDGGYIASSAATGAVEWAGYEFSNNVFGTLDTTSQYAFTGDSGTWSNIPLYRNTLRGNVSSYIKSMLGDSELMELYKRGYPITVPNHGWSDTTKTGSGAVAQWPAYSYVKTGGTGNASLSCPIFGMSGVSTYNNRTDLTTPIIIQVMVQMNVTGSDVTHRFHYRTDDIVGDLTYRALGFSFTNTTLSLDTFGSVLGTVNATGTYAVDYTYNIVLEYMPSTYVKMYVNGVQVAIQTDTTKIPPNSNSANTCYLVASITATGTDAEFYFISPRIFKIY